MLRRALPIAEAVRAWAPAFGPIIASSSILYSFCHFVSSSSAGGRWGPSVTLHCPLTVRALSHLSQEQKGCDLVESSRGEKALGEEEFSVTWDLKVDHFNHGHSFGQVNRGAAMAWKLCNHYTWPYEELLIISNFQWPENSPYIFYKCWGGWSIKTCLWAQWWKRKWCIEKGLVAICQTVISGLLQINGKWVTCYPFSDLFML